MKSFKQSRNQRADESTVLSVSSFPSQTAVQPVPTQRVSLSGAKHSLANFAITREDVVSEQGEQVRAQSVIMPQVRRPGNEQQMFSGKTGLVIQRAVAAKDSLALASAKEVPDLPQSLVDELKKACQSTAKDTDRQKVLDDLYQYLKTGSAKSIIDNVDKLKYGGLDATTYGVTVEIPNQRPNFANKVQVKIFSAAFDSGAAVVYTTIRHELIHAEQYRQTPSTAPENDPFFYAARGKTGDKKALKGGTSTEQALKQVLDEIETYSWEITHAGETGVQGSTYLDQRVKELGFLYDNLIKYSGELTPARQPTWKNLIAKAEQMVEDAMKSQNTPLVKRTIKWRVDLSKKTQKQQLALSMQQQSGGIGTVNMKRTKGTNKVP
jgi:hypothetical protein